MKAECLSCKKLKPISKLISGVCYKCREKELKSIKQNANKQNTNS